MADAAVPVDENIQLGGVPDGEQLSGRAVLLLLAVASFVVETVALLKMQQVVITLLAVGLVHVAVCSVLWGFAVFNMWRDRWRRGDLLLALMITTTGPIGAMGCVFAFILHKLYSRKARSFQEWYESLFPDEVRDAAMELFDDIESGRESLASASSVTSFGDILAYGSFEQKLAVLALVSRHFRPEFAVPLKQALEDESAAIRVRAATAMAEVENTYLNRALRLSKALDEEPDNFDVNLAMARFLDDYVYSGILDEATETKNRREAFKYYEKCHELDRSNQDVHLAIARILLREGKHEETVNWLRYAQGHGLTDPRADDWFMESLYVMGDFDALRAAAADHYSQDPNNDLPTRRTGEVAGLWASGGKTMKREAESASDAGERAGDRP